MGAPEDSPEIPWGHLTATNQRRLAGIMRIQVPEVFRANRVIEEATGYVSEIGTNMMADVLSHLGTLAADGPELDHEQQASQLAKIEEHLRRALFEHPEEVVRNRLGEVEERWTTYQREAFPYRERGTLPNAPRHRELEELRDRVHRQMELARRRKPEETTWEETLDAAAAITEAVALTKELADKLEQCIGAAQERQRAIEREDAERRRHRTSNMTWAAGIAVMIALAVGGYLLGRADTDDGVRGEPPAAQQQEVIGSGGKP